MGEFEGKVPEEDRFADVSESGLSFGDLNFFAFKLEGNIFFCGGDGGGDSEKGLKMKEKEKYK